MSDNDANTNERLDRLEEAVRVLRERFDALELATRPAPETPPPPRPLPAQRPAAIRPTPRPAIPRGDSIVVAAVKSATAGGQWLSKIGIALLLFGVAFLFKYAVDQGWLTPSVRVGFGLVLGALLLALNLRLRPRRPQFARVLGGGAIATWYITGFAAFQLFALVSHPVAFVFMVSVTLVAFALSLTQEDALFALIGTVGGLCTPFLLYTEEGSIPGLVTYTCLIVAGVYAIYIHRGWRTVLWLGAFIGWVVLFATVESGSFFDEPLPFEDRGVVTAGVLFSGLLMWLVPMLRRIWYSSRAGVQPETLGLLDSQLGSEAGRLFNAHAHLLVIIAPLVCLSLTSDIWHFSDRLGGGIALFGAVLFALPAVAFYRRESVRPFGYAHGLAAIILAVIGCFWILDGEPLVIALAVLSLGVHLLALALEDRHVHRAGHGLTLIALATVLERLAHASPSTAMLNARAIADLAALAAVGVATYLLRDPDQRPARAAYAGALYVLLLTWFYRELAGQINGQGLISVSWGVIGAATLLLGLRLGRKRVHAIGIATLLLVVGKLFVVDLASVRMLWRALLFLGFGALFLLLSYHYRSVWAGKEETAEPPPPESPPLAG